MSDVIAARFEADANDFIREVTKARESVKKLSENAPKMRQEMDAAFQKTTAGAKNAGQGLMQLAYFADDAQYGIKGLMNNIPGLAMSLGAGAGLAGGISLAVLAGAHLAPILGDLTGLTDRYGDALRMMADAQDKVIGKYKLAGEAAEAAAASRAALNHEMEGYEVTQKEIGRSPLVDETEREIAALRRRYEVEREVTMQSFALREAKAKNPVEAQAVQGERDSALRSMEQAMLKKEISLRDNLEKKMVDSLSVQMKMADELRSKQSAELAMTEKQIAALEEKANAQRRTAEAAAASLQAAKDAGLDLKKPTTFKDVMTKAGKDFDDKNPLGPWNIIKGGLDATLGGTSDFDPTALRKTMEQASAAAEKYQGELANAQKRNMALSASLKATATTTEAMTREHAAAANAQIDARDAAAQQLTIYDKTKGTLEELAQVEMQRARQERAGRDLAAERKRMAEDARRAAEVRKEQGKAREDVFGEVQALALQAAGREREANALRESMKLRRDAAELAERAGISEKQAQGILARKLELEKAVAGEKRKAEAMLQRNDGRIRLFKRGESAGGAFGGGAREGLGASVIERNVRIAEQRAAARGGDSPAAQATATKMDDLHGTMRKMLEVWQSGLGVK